MHLHIVVDAEGKFGHLDSRKVIHVREFTITGLEGGTKSGQPSVAVIVELPNSDGKWVFAETTLKLFLTAADALKAKYGDPRKEAEGSA